MSRTVVRTPAYRPDIDGLRAVAVLLVLMFHAWPNQVPGGFIGVDIFFVISGFFISGILLRGLEQDCFSAATFYARRIRRIFPALALVLLACLGMGWFVMLAEEYQMLGRHIWSGAAFVSNFVLISEAGYFDTAAELKPLLHLWSLGIEEQFYLVWPLLLLGAHRLRINLLAAIVVLALLSFGLNVARVDAHLVQTFYQPLTRFWELLAGAALAYCVLHHGGAYQRWCARYGNASAVAGLALLALALAATNSSRMFPGWWASLPTAAAVLLIGAGPQAWLNRQVLALPVLVFVGLISYPLYLWHWPLLSFVRIAESSDPAPALIWAALALAVLLAWLTYAVLEKRVRHSTSRPLLAGLVALLALAGAVGLVLQRHQGYPAREALARYQEFHRQMKREPATDPGCADYVGQNAGPLQFNYCRAANLDFKKWFAIIGDSHAHVLFPGFSEQFARRGYGTILLANSSCPALLGTATGKTPAEIAVCAAKNRQIFQLLKQEARIDKVLIATRGPVYITGNGFGPAEKADVNQDIRPALGGPAEARSARQIYFAGLAATVGDLLGQGRQVAYFLENPELGVVPENCMGRPFTFAKKSMQCTIDVAVYRSRMADYRAGFFAMRSGFPRLLTLDPEPLLCNARACSSILNKKLLYADDDHFSVEGSRYVAGKLAGQLFPN